MKPTLRQAGAGQGTEASAPLRGTHWWQAEDAHQPSSAPSNNLPLCFAPLLLPPRSRQGLRQRSSAPVGHHHFSVIPCKLTRCLAALPCLSPCLPLLQGRVLRQQRGHAVINAGAGSPAVSAHHVLHCVSGCGLPASPAQAGLATVSPGRRVALAHRVPETSHSCPSPQRSRSSWPSHAGAGWNTPAKLPCRPHLLGG